MNNTIPLKFSLLFITQDFFLIFLYGVGITHLHMAPNLNKVACMITPSGPILSIFSYAIYNFETLRNYRYCQNNSSKMLVWVSRQYIIAYPMIYTHHALRIKNQNLG